MEHRISLQHKGQIAALAAAFLFGCSAPLISTLTGEGSALSIAALLYAGATLGLLAARLLRRGPSQESPVRRTDLPALVALTFLGGVVGPLALVLGLGRLSPASGSLLLNLEAVFTLAIAVLVGREHLGKRGLLAVSLTMGGAVVVSGGSVSGASWQGSALIAVATLAWGIDNNLSQRLSLRDPIQIALLKAAGASVPMLLVAFLLGERFPSPPQALAVLLIGVFGYGLSIWLDLLALRELGAAREAVIFSTAPFVGGLFSVVVLREPLTPALVGAAVLMAGGVGLLLRENHGHWHQHERLLHDHRHCHDPIEEDPHHRHEHTPKQLEGFGTDGPYWHAHEHRHEETEHAHAHVSDAHHRHQH
ncbi:MAG: EamA family transporter [Synechococcaceae cyanobacterium ELA445]|jgi:drug/metabolite transporter (DMT)-like permease